MPPHGGRWLRCQRRGRAGPQTPHSGVPWGHRCLRRAGGSRGRQAIQTPRCRANSSGFSDHLSPKHSGTQGPRSFPGFTDCPHTLPRHSGAALFSGRLAELPLSSGSFCPSSPPAWRSFYLSPLLPSLLCPRGPAEGMFAKTVFRV